MAKAIKKTRVSKPETKMSDVDMSSSAMKMDEMKSEGSMSDSLRSSRRRSPKLPAFNPKFLRATLLIVLLGLLTYKAGPWLFPAVVDNRPVSRFELWSKMEKAYGTQTLDDAVNEKVLDAAIAKNGVKVEQAKIDEQMSNLEKQFENVGGLDEALKQRGLTRDELKKQVVTQLSVEEILKDKVNPTDDEVKADFESNKATLYKDKKIEDVSAEIATRLKDTKLREAFLEWFAEVKKDITVKNFGL